MVKLLLVIFVCLAVAAAHSSSPRGHSKTNSRSNSNQKVQWVDKYHARGVPKASAKGKQSTERSQDYWKKMAKEIVSSHLEENNKNKAKNIIMFLGDGMGIQTVTAARVLLGDENKSLAFETFRHAGGVKTYCVDAQVADSACTATAYLTGVKTNLGVTGVNAQLKMGDCQDDPSAHVDSIAKWAQDAGKSTGLVTTARVTHASPSAVYAHSANRDWEADSWITGCDGVQIDDIAKQLIRGEVGSKLNVIMGGGRQLFLNSTVTDEFGVKGGRRDGLDLLSEWVNDGKKNKKLVKTRAQLMAVDTKKTDYLLGLFSGSHMKYYAEGDKSEPTLWDMTKKALEVLQRNKNGFFLFVEGGKIDHGHHENQAGLALTEALQFSEAIEKTRAMFSEKDTLIVTTADHSHVMSISGYPSRGNDILGISTSDALDDGLPYFTLNYANGPSYGVHIKEGVGRVNPEDVHSSDIRFQHPSMVEAPAESHGGEDVPVYASGPWSHLFTGTIEQNAIPHFMAYAACIGKGLTMCR